MASGTGSGHGNIAFAQAHTPNYTLTNLYKAIYFVEKLTFLRFRRTLNFVPKLSPNYY